MANLSGSLLLSDDDCLMAWLAPVDGVNREMDGWKDGRMEGGSTQR